ncbi:Glycerol uptake protein-like protein [Emericellopsis cladophorae]|uniref:Glycerol uptake protein-like protein n=1 Tax=Emericellopsis cladophorae TaxID=2686198 RepID=A0A9P9Y2E4_9HYPO|nr:Glycerol uptake protein-like protein [Emericellopsis cladophorae]KAI6782261.1 Glycerol uptake protein-like protein [Emericellopsis cladophorae]
MGPLTLFRNIYDLDTLDTRFTSSSQVPYQTVIDARSDPATSRLKPAKAPPSKWRSLEFFFYYAVILIAVLCMFWVPYQVSRPEDPRYGKYAHYLWPGWVPGRRIDISDSQYYTFRGNLPAMTALLIFHPLLRKGWNAVFPASDKKEKSGGRLEQRASFDFAFAILFLFILHGVSAFKIIVILNINYRLATQLPRRYIPFGTWAFNVPLLFANDICNGYRFRDIAYYVAPPLQEWGGWLDSYGGIMSRWDILFNITILRLISFNMDYYWSLGKSHASSIEKKQLNPAELSERDRVSISANAHDYTWRNFVAYAIYAPLYLVGPILTFNDYISQSKHKVASIERPRTIRYAIRFILVLLTMELLLHFNYVNAISKNNPDWGSYTAAQLSLLSFMNLHIIWLKLLLPWRLFRLWSLVDGIDPPENMVRCVSNNYSTQLFWRSWHRSYNRWIVRYIYVPLGGSSFRTWQSTLRSIFTYLLSFTFVALWHDIQMRLLIWGWLIVLFMVPEWVAAWLFPKHKWESRPTEYRMLCCVGAVGNVLMMISANLVGFALGLDGLEVIVKSILHTWSGVMFIMISCGCLFTGIQVMFEVRETEKRKGVALKC